MCKYFFQTFSHIGKYKPQRMLKNISPKIKSAILARLIHRIICFFSIKPTGGLVAICGSEEKYRISEFYNLAKKLSWKLFADRVTINIPMSDLFFLSHTCYSLPGFSDTGFKGWKQSHVILVGNFYKIFQCNNVFPYFLQRKI